MIPTLILAAALAGPPPRATCYNLGPGRGAAYHPVSDREILVSAGLHAYRIETEPSPALGLPSTNLQVGGRGVVCSPLDLRLYAVGPGVGRTGLIVRSITPLSRAEAEELRGGAPKRSVLRR